KLNRRSQEREGMSRNTPSDSPSCMLMMAAFLLWGTSNWAVATEPEWQSLFDGQTLQGWDGDPQWWRVEDGAITGETAEAGALQENTFIIWRDGYLDDFELKLQYRLEGGNSGIQYRSFEVPDKRWAVGGYQADLEAGDRYSGILYGERFRGILADRGTRTRLVREQGELKPQVEQVKDPAELQRHIKKSDWNEYRVVAQGHTLKHYINGVLMSECDDQDLGQRRSVGILALQLHTGPAMKVQFKDIQLKRLPGRKKVVFVAGKASHGFGTHEHRAGCLLLAEALEASGLPVDTTVVTDGWPADPSVFEGADAIVIYADGGSGHPAFEHLDQLQQLQQAGVGLVCLHYAVEVPTGRAGDDFLKWLGGYFETNWSVNPHWTAEFKQLPEHPTTRGVQPFTMHDEWYYHMRFRDAPQGWTPVLSALPPDDTLSRPDGPHSNNPAVRAAVLARAEPQHTAWALQRIDGGRGFGLTGGHYHWGWGQDDLRKLVLNAICWAAHLEVPEGGVRSATPTLDDLLKNQDMATPPDFDAADIQQRLDQANER
ncbi:MAG: family 16 glycoside hydrolase, partial [Planctomycetota bacterium]